MSPKASYGDAALIWNALCGKWIFTSAGWGRGVGRRHNLKPDLTSSSKLSRVKMFGTRWWGFTTQTRPDHRFHRELRMLHFSLTGNVTWRKGNRHCSQGDIEEIITRFTRILALPPFAEKNINNSKTNPSLCVSRIKRLSDAVCRHCMPLWQRTS